MLVGIDEVGRGCWAGPVVAGAVALRKPIAGVKDSKQLTRQQREILGVQIRAEALAFGIGWAAPEEIDNLGMTAAITLAMERALVEIGAVYSEVVIDGAYNFLRSNPKARCLTKADLFMPAVSAASIIAKVARDRFMADASAQFPGYGFEKHVGYGTAVHNLALQKLGVCELHRRSFAPIRQVLGGI
jgi:ribonuclease HII